MSHFYGSIQGTKGEATRCGDKNNGLVSYCASWNGAIRSRAYVDEDGVDCVSVEKVPWHGEGENRLLYEGPIGKCGRGPVVSKREFTTHSVGLLSFKKVKDGVVLKFHKQPQVVMNSEQARKLLVELQSALTREEFAAKV